MIRNSDSKRKKKGDNLVDPFKNTISRISGPLSSLSTKSKLKVLLFTSRPEYFDGTDLLESTDSIECLTYFYTEDALRACDDRFDLALVCTHVLGEHKAQLIVREKKLAPLIVVWTWDNHHHRARNLSGNTLADIVIPAHSENQETLKTPHSLLGTRVPLGTSQWSRALTSKLLFRNPEMRSEALSGGYVLWPHSARNEVLRRLKTRIPENALSLLDPNNRSPYFSLSVEARFRQWTSYMVSLIIPFNRDLSMRVFDALIAGQIPIVPEDCVDLDSTVPPDIQRRLPIIRVSDLSPQSVELAWRLAIKQFKERGVEGIVTRHEYARDYHHISARIKYIVEYLRGLSTKTFAVESDSDCVGLVVADNLSIQ